MRNSDGSTTTSVATAAGGAEVVVLAVPGAAVPDVIVAAGDSLSGALVIDATNRMGGGPANSHASVTGVPGARYARAFNSIGADTLQDPTIDGVPVDMVYACSSADRTTVAGLIEAAGARPVWAGDDRWDVCDAALSVWLGLARTYGRRLGLRVLNEPGPEVTD